MARLSSLSTEQRDQLSRRVGLTCSSLMIVVGAYLFLGVSQLLPAELARGATLDVAAAVTLLGLSVLVLKLRIAEWFGTTLNVMVIVISALRVVEYALKHSVLAGWGETLHITVAEQLIAPMPLGTALVLFSSAAILIYATVVDHRESSGPMLVTGSLFVASFGICSLLAGGYDLHALEQWQVFFDLPVPVAISIMLVAVTMFFLGVKDGFTRLSFSGLSIASIFAFTGFLLDLSTTLLSSTVVYVPVVLSTIYFGARKMGFHFAFLCSLFAIVAFFAEVEFRTELLRPSLGRFFSVVTLWVVAILVFYFKKASDEITAGQIRFEALLNYSPDAVVTIDASGHVTEFNHSAERMFGFDRREVLGRNIAMLMPEPYRSGHDGYLQHYHDTGEKRIIGTIREVAGRKKDGTEFPIDLSISVLSEDENNQFVGIIRDLTARKESQRVMKAALSQLSTYAADLERSNQELDEFAYIASHDLKEPLRGIHNHSRFLLEDYEESLDEDGVRRLNRMIYLTQRMEKLVNDLLYFSRLGRRELAIGQTDLNEVVADVIETMEQTIEEHRAEVRINGSLPTLVCDRTRVTEVFRNLISNGVKYNDNAARIVEIGWLEQQVDDHGHEMSNVVYVRDNGKGIDPQFHRDIFRIFKRLENNPDGREGTGVGLTFVKKIIERHGGQIWLDSAPGKGTTFYFTLERAGT